VPGAPLPEVWERSFGHDDHTKKIRLDLSPKVGDRGVFHGAYIARRVKIFMRRVDRT
jgi:hypothetical protein